MSSSQMRAPLLPMVVLVSACVADAPGTQPPRDRTDVIDLAVGELHRCAVSSSGQVSCWGHGPGMGPLHEAEGPAPIFIDANVIDVEVASERTCVLTEDGRVACWGDNTFGAVDGSKLRTEPSREGFSFCSQGEPTDADPGNVRTNPTFIPDLEGVVQLAVGQRHTCALDEQEFLTCWGQNQDGSLGAATPGESFQRVTTSAPGAIAVAVGHSDTCLVLADGTVDCFGRGDLPTPPEQAFREVTLARGRSCGITIDGELWCWGTAGACALDEEIGVWSVADRSVQSVSLGFGTCIDCYVDAQGHAQCWPGITYRDDTTAPWSSVERVPLAGVTAIGSAGNDACALTNAGDVYCWATSRLHGREAGRIQRIRFPGD